MDWGPCSIQPIKPRQVWPGMAMPRAVLALALFLLAPLASATGAAPVAAFTTDRSTGIPETGDGLGTEFRFIPGSTTDPDTPFSDLELRWDWEGDGSWDTAWAPFSAGYHGYTAAGTYSPALEVRDPQGNVDSAVGGPLLVEATRTLTLGQAASGSFVEEQQRHDYTLVVPESHLNLVIDLDWAHVAGNNLDLYVRMDGRPDRNNCSPPACVEAASTQTGGVERICIRFSEPGTYHVEALAWGIGSTSASVPYTLLARADVLEASTAPCLAAGQLPSVAFVAGLPLP